MGVTDLLKIQALPGRRSSQCLDFENFRSPHPSLINSLSTGVAWRLYNVHVISYISRVALSWAAPLVKLWTMREGSKRVIILRSRMSQYGTIWTAGTALNLSRSLRTRGWRWGIEWLRKKVSTIRNLFFRFSRKIQSGGKWGVDGEKDLLRNITSSTKVRQRQNKGKTSQTSSTKMQARNTRGNPGTLETWQGRMLKGFLGIKLIQMGLCSWIHSSQSDLYIDACLMCFPIFSNLNFFVLLASGHSSSGTQTKTTGWRCWR